MLQSNYWEGWGRLEAARYIHRRVLCFITAYNIPLKKREEQEEGEEDGDMFRREAENILPLFKE